METLKKIGLQINAARKAQKIGHQKLANLTGLSKHTCIRIDRGDEPYDIINLIKICEVLGIKNIELFT